MREFPGTGLDDNSRTNKHNTCLGLRFRGHVFAEIADPPILPLRKQGESAISSPEAANGETSPLKMSLKFLTERPGFEPGVELLALQLLSRQLP